MPASYQSITLPTANAAEQLQFDGVLLAHRSSEEASGKRARRWTEYAIYRRRDGKYIASHIARSRVEDERDLYRVAIADDARGAFDSLLIQTGQSKGAMTLLAMDTLAAAAEADKAFESSLDDRLEIEDLAGDVAGGTEYVLDRDNDRALRFHGVFLADASTRRPGATAWLRVAVFRTMDGRYVLHKTKETDEPDPDRAMVAVIQTGTEAIEALRRPGIAWLEDAALDALEDAAAIDEQFEALIGPQLDNFRFKAITGVESRFKTTGRDSRRDVLATLARGARLIVSDGDELRVLAWNDAPPNTRLPAARVVRALSRQRLIRRVDAHEAKPGKVEWELSDRGRALLEASS